MQGRPSIWSYCTKRDKFSDLENMRASVYGVPRAARVLESEGPSANLTVDDEMNTNTMGRT
jgi:hypothetical protein